MPSTSFSTAFSNPRVDLAIDTGNPFLNTTVDGFLKIGTVAAAKTLAEEGYYVVRKGSISRTSVEHSLKRMCKEGVYWGTVAGVYVGLNYGTERIRGTGDWKNAMIAGALTGALISATSSNSRDKIVVDAITGGAIATASKFINHLT